MKRTIAPGLGRLERLDALLAGRSLHPPRPRSGAHYNVCVDFDGVLHAYYGWRGTEHLNAPVPGALEFVQELLDDHYVVIVLTTRPESTVTAWLQEHGFPALPVTDRKPQALVYIDDKGFRFTGDWHAAKAAVQARLWWEGKP